MIAPGSERKLLWLDCDPGHDDAVAILLALYEPRIELLGLSTVHGNASLENTTANAARCLHAFGAPEHIKVYPGASKPIVGLPHPAVDIHGNDGLGGVVGLPPKDDPAVIARIVTPDQFPQEADRHALPAIVAIRDACIAAVNRNTTIYLGVTGSATNAAIFLMNYPDLAKKAIKQIVCMGGAVGLGNITPAAEFNIYVDPDAVQVVYDFDIPVFAIPLNVTHQTLFHHEAHRFLLDPGSYASTAASPTSPLPEAVTPLRYMFSTLLTFFTETYENVFNFKQGPPIHDVLVVSYIADPSLFTGLLTRVDVDRNETLSKGAMIVDVYDNALHEAKNVEVAQEVDVSSVLRSFFLAVAQADQASPLNKGISVSPDVPEPPKSATRSIVTHVRAQRD